MYRNIKLRSHFEYVKDYVQDLPMYSANLTFCPERTKTQVSSISF